MKHDNTANSHFSLCVCQRNMHITSRQIRQTLELWPILQAVRAASDSRSLVLLDEVGTGTEPVEGSALGVALLETLVKGGRGGAGFTMATTHHRFALETAVHTSGSDQLNKPKDRFVQCGEHQILSFIHSFTHSLTHSFTHSLTHHSLTTHSPLTHPPTHPPIPSSVHPCIQLFVCPSVHLSVHPFVHSTSSLKVRYEP